MNEETTRSTKKDIIKNITIIFLVILLLLTFFSNTIMNYSLPQVSTTYPSSGVISEQIRGSGTVEAMESYEVNFSQEREIAVVRVKEGDEVKKGDVLFELADSESTELASAKSTLANAKNEYEKAVITAGIEKNYDTDELEITQKREELNRYKNQLVLVEDGTDSLSVANDILAEDQKKYDEIKAQIDDYTLQATAVSTEDMIDLKGSYYTQLRAAKDAVAEAERKAEKAKKEYDKAVEDATAYTTYTKEVNEKRAAIEVAEVELNNLYNTLYSMDDDSENNQNNNSDDQNVSAGKDTTATQNSINLKQAEINKLKNELLELIKSGSGKLSNANIVQSAQGKLDRANDDVVKAKNRVTDLSRNIKLEIKKKIDDLNKQLAVYDKKVKDDTADITEITTNGGMSKAALEKKIRDTEDDLRKLVTALDVKKQNDIDSNATSDVDLRSKKQAVDDAQAKVDELEKNSFGATVTAQVGGRIRSVAYTAGQKVPAGSAAATIDITEKGYKIEFTVKNDEARKLRVGAAAEMSGWYWHEAKITLAEIKPDSSNSNQKTLVFSVEGEDVMIGDTYSIQVGSKGQQYNTIVPNSAVKEDSAGKYVLVMEAKSTPLGNRYTAVKYPVTILVKDDNNSAVSGIEGGQYIITTSATPIAPGTQVRPAD